MYRSYNHLNFIRNMTRQYHADKLCMFQIGLNKRHASILIIPKHDVQYKIQKFSYSQKIYTNKKIGRNEDGRWIGIAKFSSDEAKTKKDKSEKKLAEDVQQKIIELNEEKLGKLKERVLNIEPVDSSNDKEKGREATKFAEKQSVESKELSKDDVTSKKGIIY